jgi:hypothetical protein
MGLAEPQKYAVLTRLLKKQLAARETLKNTIGFPDYLGIPFVADSKEEALKRAHLF